MLILNPLPGLLSNFIIIHGSIHNEPTSNLHQADKLTDQPEPVPQPQARPARHGAQGQPPAAQDLADQGRQLPATQGRLPESPTAQDLRRSSRQTGPGGEGSSEGSVPEGRTS